MASIFVLTLLFVTTVPLFACAVLARKDAIRGRRHFGQRIFYTAILCSALFGGIILLVFFAIISPQARPPNVNVGIAWGGVLFGCGIVFLTSAFTGSIGYATSYRLFDRGPVPSEDHPIDPKTRGEETGNPYQPPTI